MADVLNQVVSGTGFVGLVAWTLISLLVGAAGGALGGMFIGAAALGKELAAMMGAFYGIVAAVPGILLAFLILNIF